MYTDDNGIAKNNKKAKRHTIFGAILTVFNILGLLAFLTQPVDTTTSDYVSLFVFLGLGILLLYLGARRRKKSKQAQQLDLYFRGDADGLVPVEDIAPVLGIKRENARRFIDNMMQENMIKNCRINEDGHTIELFGGKSAAFYTNSFCPNCGAKLEYSAVKRPHFRMSGTARPRRGYRLSALRYR